MVKNILVLDDGTEIRAGVVGENAILSLIWTEQLSSTTDLCPGSACASKLELTIWVEPGNNLLITSQTRLRYYRETTSGRTLAGTFWAVKPTRQTRNTYKIYAYDSISKLDGIQSTWLRSIQDNFPMSLWDFAQMVANRCGVEIVNDSLSINGNYQVQAFYADNLTGRQLLSWVAEASGTFLHATPDGRIEFAWYSAGDNGVSPTSEGRECILVLAGDTLYTKDDQQFTLRLPTPFYYQSSLSFEDYMTAPINKVQIKSSDDDVGAVYPPDETGTNAWVISENLLLSPTSAQDLETAAQALFPVLEGVSYRPCKFETADDGTLRVGQIVNVQDSQGGIWTTWLMSAEHKSGRVTFECTGNASRDDTAAVNEQSYANLRGRVLEISASVDGLQITAKDLQGGLSQLEITVDGLSTTVQKQYTDLTNYVDEKTGQIKDEAVNDAVQQAVQQIDQSLTFYPTKVEMNSAIEQSAGKIELSVNQTLTGYSTTQQMQQYVNGQTSGILSDAQDYTDGQLQKYPTTVEMNSAIKQSANNINLQVNSKLTMYPTTSDMQDYVDGKTDNLPTTSDVQNMIDVGIDGITLSASTSGTTSTLTLRHNGLQVTSASITFSGLVTFQDLSGSGSSVINGDNITTGKIGSEAGNTVYDLDAGTLRTGRSGSNRVEMDDRGIKWYVENGGKSYLTGVLYSKYGATYIGDNSRYTFLGWFSSGTPDFGWSSGGAHSNFVGIAIDQTGATIHCNARKFEIPGRIECTTLAVNGREI